MDAATESKPTYEQHRGSARAARDGPAERDQPHRQREPHVTAGTDTAESRTSTPGSTTKGRPTRRPFAGGDGPSVGGRSSALSIRSHGTESTKAFVWVAWFLPRWMGQAGSLPRSGATSRQSAGDRRPGSVVDARTRRSRRSRTRRPARPRWRRSPAGPQRGRPLVPRPAPVARAGHTSGSPSPRRGPARPWR